MKRNFRTSIFLIFILVLVFSTAAGVLAKSQDSTTGEYFEMTTVQNKDGKMDIAVEFLDKLSKTQELKLVLNEFNKKENIDVEVINKKKLKVRNLDGTIDYMFSLKIHDRKDGSNVVTSYSGILYFIIIPNEEENKKNPPKALLRDVVKTNYLEGDRDEELSSMATIYEVEPNYSTSLADTIGSGDDVYGKISSDSDVDYFKITFSNTGTANFFLGNIPADKDYDMYIYDSAGNLVYKSINGTGQNELLLNKSVNGNQTYYIKIFGYLGDYDPNNYYLLRAKLNKCTSSTDCSNLNWTWPTEETGINSPYGWRTYNGGEYHKGIDIQTSTTGKEVYAADYGIVKSVRVYSDDTEQVTIEHDSLASNGNKLTSRSLHVRGDSSTYNHVVSEQQVVAKGQLIAYSGDTGRVSAHLHFDINDQLTLYPVYTSSVEDTVNPDYFYDCACTSTLSGSSLSQSEGEQHSIEESHDEWFIEELHDEEHSFSLQLIQSIGEQEFNDWFYSLDMEQRTQTNLKEHFNLTTGK